LERSDRGGHQLEYYDCAIASTYVDGVRPITYYQAGFKGFGASPGTVTSPVLPLALWLPT